MLIVGPCSATKRYPVDPLLDAARVKAKTLTIYADRWRDRITAAQPAAPASEMYAGAGHVALQLAAEHGGARLLFVSAGMGVVPATERIPAYDLTVARHGPGPFSVLEMPHDPRAWWSAVHPSRSSPLTDYIRKSSDAVVLALPAAYLSMVSQDLAHLTTSQLRRLRVISTPGLRLPQALQAQAICYDSRLNGLGAPYSGSMPSLVQRAALHFVTTVMSDRRITAVDGQRARVERCLAQQPAVRKIERASRTDAQIRKKLGPMARRSLSATRALAELRTVHGIACEQSRFRQIYEEALNGAR